MHLCINTGKPQHTCSMAELNLTLIKEGPKYTNAEAHSVTVTSRTDTLIHINHFTYVSALTNTHNRAHKHTPNYGPLIVRLSNNQDATSCAALAGFAFHTSLLFKDTQGREWNHLSQREAQRLEAPAAEKPVYFGWQNTLGYGCICALMSVCIQACSCVYAEYIHFCICDDPKEQLCLWIN